MKGFVHLSQEYSNETNIQREHKTDECVLIAKLWISLIFGANLMIRSITILRMDRSYRRSMLKFYMLNFDRVYGKETLLKNPYK